MKNPQISPSGRVSPRAPLDLVHWIKDWIHYPSWLPRGWRQQTSILGYVVLLCTSLLISDLSVEETWLQKRASSAKWDKSVSGSLVRMSGFSLQLCSRIPGSSQLDSSSLSVLQVANMYGHFGNSVTTYSSCSNWHVSPWVVPLSWHPLKKVSELHSQQVRAKTKVENCRHQDRSRNSSRDSVPCFPRRGRKLRGTCCPLSPEEDRWSLPNKQWLTLVSLPPSQ